MTPMKTPPLKSPSVLRRSNAFCLSPASAAAYSSRILSRIEERKKAQAGSAPDGRRTLFPVEGMQGQFHAVLSLKFATCLHYSNKYYF